MARLSFRCSGELVESVDLARGAVARERWLRGVVEEAVAGLLVGEVERRRVEAGRRVVADPLSHPSVVVEGAERALVGEGGLVDRSRSVTPVESRADLFRRAASSGSAKRGVGPVPKRGEGKR